MTPPTATPKSPDGAESQIADYIAEMTTEMMVMASGANLDLLAYLLSMARTEAEIVSRRGHTGVAAE